MQRLYLLLKLPLIIPISASFTTSNQHFRHILLLSLCATHTLLTHCRPFLFHHYTAAPLSPSFCPFHRGLAMLDRLCHSSYPSDYIRASPLEVLSFIDPSLIKSWRTHFSASLLLRNKASLTTLFNSASRIIRGLIYWNNSILFNSSLLLSHAIIIQETDSGKINDLIRCCNY